MCAFGETKSHGCTDYTADSTTDTDISGLKVSDAITHLLQLMDELPLNDRPRTPAYESQLRQQRNCIESYARSLPISMLSEINIAISRSVTISSRELFIMSNLLVLIDKENMLCVLRKMYHIPTTIGYIPFSVYLYHIGITLDELNSILDEPDLHPSAIASIAIMVHQYKFGVYIIGQPLSGKVPIKEAANILRN